LIRAFLDRLFFSIFAGAIVFALAGVGIYYSLSRDLPQLPETLENINLSLPTEIYSADGERLKVIGERRPVIFEDISPYFIKAIISIEDSRFYDHSGFDHIGFGRAMLANIRAGKVIQEPVFFFQ
jgi:penicillin-binding protein 1A